jgi:hypothetical protein
LICSCFDLPAGMRAKRSAHNRIPLGFQGAHAVKGCHHLGTPACAVDRIRAAATRMVKALPLQELAWSALASGRQPCATTPWHAVVGRFAASGSHPFVK